MSVCSFRWWSIPSFSHWLVTGCRRLSVTPRRLPSLDESYYLPSLQPISRISFDVHCNDVCRPDERLPCASQTFDNAVRNCLSLSGASAHRRTLRLACVSSNVFLSCYTCRLQSVWCYFRRRLQMRASATTRVTLLVGCSEKIHKNICIAWVSC